MVIEIDMAKASDDDVRRTGIGGGDIAAIVGEDPYKSAINVWDAKVNGNESEMSERARRGKLLEPHVLDWYRDETIEHKQLVIAPIARMRSPSLTWRIGQPDAVVYEPERAFSSTFPFMTTNREHTCSGLLDARRGDAPTTAKPDWIVEVKTHGFQGASRYGEENSDDIPRNYLCQANWYLDMVGVDRCDFAVLLDTHEYKTFRVYRDEKLIEVLLEAGEVFWMRNVVGGIKPDPDGSKSRTEWIKKRLKWSNNNLVERASPTLADRIIGLRSLRDQADRLEKAIEKVVQEIKEAMGDAALLVDADGNELASWKTNGRGNPSYKDALHKLAHKFGATDAEIDEAIESTRGEASRPFKLNRR